MQKKYKTNPRTAMLKNKLLSSQNRIIRKPLMTWIAKLREAIQFLCPSTINFRHAKQVAAIFNEAAIIFISANQMKYAREICYSHMHLFFEME